MSLLSMISEYLLFVRIATEFRQDRRSFRDWLAHFFDFFFLAVFVAACFFLLFVAAFFVSKMRSQLCENFSVEPVCTV